MLKKIDIKTTLRLKLITLIIGIVCSASVAMHLDAASARQIQAGEYQVKAGFLYKFLFFTEWPEETFADNKSPIMIGILGKDSFGDIFKKIEGQPVDGRKLIIKRFREVPPGRTLRQCQLLFIDPSLKGKMKNILQSLDGYPVLTVSEVKGFTHSGGMINFVTKKNKVVFEINRAAAKRSGIRFRSKLLRVAAEVIEN